MMRTNFFPGLGVSSLTLIPISGISPKFGCSGASFGLPPPQLAPVGGSRVL